MKIAKMMIPVATIATTNPVFNALIAEDASSTTIDPIRIRIQVDKKRFSLFFHMSSLHASIYTIDEITVLLEKRRENIRKFPWETNGASSSPTQKFIRHLHESYKFAHRTEKRGNDTYA